MNPTQIDHPGIQKLLILPKAMMWMTQPYTDQGLPVRFRVAWGGRGATKTHTFGRVGLKKSFEREGLILCGREYQTSIGDSVKAVLDLIIASLQLKAYFKSHNTYIQNRVTGTEFVFKGLKQNIGSLKGIEALILAWLEESEHTTQASWDKLEPTVRMEGSEIWANLNPDKPTDFMYKTFVANTPPPDAIVRRVLYSDNPWLSTPLANQEARMRVNDPDRHAHIWLGETVKFSAAAVLRDKWRYATPEEAAWMEDPTQPHPAGVIGQVGGPYYGLDFGFSQDPTAGSRSFTHATSLYITHEMYELGLEVDHIPAAIKIALPGVEKYPLRCDNARPESISYLQRHGALRAEAVEKWPGSVEDGVAVLRAFSEIVIHPRCKNFGYECRMYSHKVDKDTGDVQPDIVDKFNHLIDAERYALQPIIRTSHKGDGILRWMSQQVEAQRAAQAAAGQTTAK